MFEPEIDQVALRTSRLARLRSEMGARNVAAVLLTDPVNIRYASGARNMQIFTARNPARYLFVTLDGPVVLYEFRKVAGSPGSAGSRGSPGAVRSEGQLRAMRGTLQRTQRALEQERAAAGAQIEGAQHRAQAARARCLLLK